MDCIFCAPPNSYVEILTSNVTALGGGAFGRWLGHENEALLNAICVPGSLTLFLPCEATTRSWQSEI